MMNIVKQRYDYLQKNGIYVMKNREILETQIQPIQNVKQEAKGKVVKLPYEEITSKIFLKNKWTHSSNELICFTKYFQNVSLIEGKQLTLLEALLDLNEDSKYWPSGTNNMTVSNAVYKFGIHFKKYKTFCGAPTEPKYGRNSTLAKYNIPHNQSVTDWGWELKHKGKIEERLNTFLKAGINYNSWIWSENVYNPPELPTYPGVSFTNKYRLEHGLSTSDHVANTDFRRETFIKEHNNKIQTSKSHRWDFSFIQPEKDLDPPKISKKFAPWWAHHAKIKCINCDVQTSFRHLGVESKKTCASYDKEKARSKTHISTAHTRAADAQVPPPLPLLPLLPPPPPPPVSPA